MEVVTNARLFLCNEDDILLLQQPSDVAGDAGTVDLPGGVVAPMEDPLDMVVRETAAATGIAVGGTAVRLVYGQTNQDLVRRRSVTRLYYAAATETHEIDVDEQDEQEVKAIWMPRWYVPAQLKDPVHRTAISYLFRQHVLPPS